MILIIYAIGVLALLMFGARLLGLDPKEDAFLLKLIAFGWPIVLACIAIGWPLVMLGKGIGYILNTIIMIGDRIH